MAVSHSTLVVVVFVAGLAAAVQGQAPAPAPVALVQGNATVDGVITLTASMAMFVNGTTLELMGVPNTTEYIKFPPAAKAGAIPQAQLTSLGSPWLGGPQAALSGTYNGQDKTVLLKLSTPMYMPSAGAITLQYVVIAANQTIASGGTVNSYASQGSSAEGNSAATLPYVTPGSTTFYNASLAVDVVGIDRYLQGSEKAGLIRVDLGAYNGGYGYYG